VPHLKQVLGPAPIHHRPPYYLASGHPQHCEFICLSTLPSLQWVSPAEKIVARQCRRLMPDVVLSRVGGVYILNLQIVHGGFCRKIEKLKTEHEFILYSQVGCRIGNWVTTSARHNSTWLNIRRQSSWASCEFNNCMTECFVFFWVGVCPTFNKVSVTVIDRW